MSKWNMPNFGGGSPDEPARRGPPAPPRKSLAASLVSVGLVLLILYGGYFWFIRRVVVGPGEVLVLLKKDGTKSHEDDQVIIPRPPDRTTNAGAYEEWEKKWGETNGILEQVHSPGTYFGFSPFDYEREVVPAVVIASDKVGVVFKKFGNKLDEGQVLVDPARDQRGPLPQILRPGTYFEYSNPYAYEVKQISPIQIAPGHRGVVTVLAGNMPRNPNDYLVEDNAQGVQRGTEPEGFRYINPFQKLIMPISIQSQRFEMTGTDAIQFPSSDSFEIRMEGFVEWSIIPDKLPLIYVQYAEASELVRHMDEKVILPYARSFCRLVGSRYNARDFISGDTKLKFQHEFEARLREACALQGIEILQALVRDIVPPTEIKNPINDREIAKQQINTLQQQIQVAHSQSDLARQTEMAVQNQKIGDANKEVVTIIKKAEQDRDVALTRARQELAVAQLRLEAARNQADALTARGQAEANVVLLNRQAEAEPLKQQIAAFGNGDAYAQYFFYQKVAPAVKSILTNTDGPFADLFQQFMQPTARPQPAAADASRP